MATPLAALVKRRYANVVRPQGSWNTMRRLAPFKAGNKIGAEVEYPIQTRYEHGITHTLGTAASLETFGSAVSQAWENARITSAGVLMKAEIPYLEMSRLGNGSEASSLSSMDMRVQGLAQSMENYVELHLGYGCGSAAAAAANLGVVNASISGANLGATQVVNLTAATWSAIWQQFMHGALIDIYQSDATTLRASDVTVTLSNDTQCRLSLFKSGSSATVAANDILLLKGAIGKSCYGLQAILQNTGTLFNISSASEPHVWRAKTYAVGGNLTRNALIGFASRMNASSGLMHGGVLFCNALHLGDLAKEIDAEDRYNDPGKDGQIIKSIGLQQLFVKTAAGVIEVVPWAPCKQGHAMFVGNINPGETVLERVGSTDITFSLDGSNEFFYTDQTTDKIGASIASMSDQGIISKMPAYCAELTGITCSDGFSPS